MTIKRPNCQHAPPLGESGAVLPIVAVLALALLSSVVILAINVFIIKDAQRRLRIAVDAICHRIAPLAINHTKASAEFNRRIEELKVENGKSFLRQTKITAARLIIPTMPQDFDRTSSAIWELSVGQDCNEGQSNNSDIPTFCNSAYTPAIDHRHTPGGLGFSFPPQTFINNNSHGDAPNAGFATGCEVVGEIRRWFSFSDSADTIPMKVKSLWWTPVRAMLKSKPGLTVAIAPEMRTNKDSELSLFSNSVNPGSLITYDGEFLNKFSALSRMANNNTFRTAAFTGGADQTYSDGTKTEKLPKLDLSFENSNLDGPLADALASCNNPIVMVRNTLVSTILELASRHGQLRDSTEVLMVNPMEASSTISSPPALITKFGQDTAKKLFQIPYVLSKQPFGNSGTISYNNPFNSTATELFQHQLLFTNQLRMCFHIYDRREDEGGIERYITPQMSDTFDNSAFEPPVYNSTFEARLRNVPYSPVLGEPLDQRNPWVKGTDSSNGDRLSAAQVAGALGTVQNCPSKAIFCSSSNNCTNVCNKNSAARQPDLIGLFRYLTKDLVSDDEIAASGAKGTKPQFFPAIREPGIHPFNKDTETNQSVPFPLQADGYQSAESNGTHILLVLHMVPDNLDRVAEFISKISSGILGPPRPITIVYIPGTPSEASQQTVNRLKAAISPVDASGVAIPQMIPPALFTLAPTGDGTTPLTNSDMISYWHKLLTEEDDETVDGEGIIEIAQSIFADRILRMELRY